MKSNSRRHYTPEFKAQAVAMLETGKPVSWRLAALRSQGGCEGPPAAGERDAADEMRALRRELTRLQVENDILKKAAVILGTSPRSSSAP